jgi:8-oxo-dGTP pyrophosphatase MutT (NUDIX family)
MTLRMPEHVLERARALLADGNWQPPLPRDATTVVLLRDGADGLEVCLLRRSNELPFAPGVHVFPGGALDAVDFDIPISGTVDGERLYAKPALALALVIAGVRETFEEVGVLLGVDGADVAPTPDAEWLADRTAVSSYGVGEALVRRGLTVSADALVPIAHWVTPAVETRRYDVRFMVARMPAGQQVVVDGSEIVADVWLSPAAAVRGADSGEYPMLPPTRAVLVTLSRAASVDEAFDIARAEVIRPLMPHPIAVGSAQDGGAAIGWVLIDAYTGEHLSSVDMPAGSEVHGVVPGDASGVGQ